MLIGSYFGAWIAVWLPQAFLRMLFAFILIYIAGYMVFSRLDSPVKTVVYAAAPAVVTVILAVLTGAFSQSIRGASAGEQQPPDLVSPEAGGG